MFAIAIGLPKFWCLGWDKLLLRIFSGDKLQKTSMTQKRVEPLVTTYLVDDLFTTVGSIQGRKLLGNYSSKRGWNINSNLSKAVISIATTLAWPNSRELYSRRVVLTIALCYVKVARHANQKKNSNEKRYNKLWHIRGRFCKESASRE